MLDLDISNFFDSINHELLLKALRYHTDCKWILLYTERWLTAPVQLQDGTLQERTQGTPQGGVISPLLANLFLHYAFDRWMRTYYKQVPFERYADDVICHLNTKEQAEQLREALKGRFDEYGLKLHPQKTKIVYCKRDNRQGRYKNEQFDFLGYTFRPRLARSRKGEFFVGFNPAVSSKAIRKMSQQIRSWKLHLWSSRTVEELAKWCNPVVSGWFNYYGSYHRSALKVVDRQLDLRLAKWAERKYRKLRGHTGRAIKWIRAIRKRNPNLFAHWRMFSPTAGL